MATPILMPKQGNSVESCLIVSWKKQKDDTVQVGDVLCEVETDKAVMDVESTASGVLLETFFSEGSDVPVQTVIAVIGNVGEDIKTFVPNDTQSSSTMKDVAQPSLEVLVAATSVTQLSTTSPATSQEGIPRISPRARLRLRDAGANLPSVQGTGPSGRVLERDIVQALKTFSPGSLPPAPSDVEVIPVQGIRKRIAERMLHSLQTTAQLTLNAWADARELLETRAIIKKNAEKFDFPNITINDLVLFAVSRTLLQHLDLNATFENEAIYKYKNIHLGFAVDTPRGLLVPVIKNAHGLKLPALALAAKQLASDSQESRVTPDALQGGTFTVSNLGSFGIEHFTPILNSPQVAILGVGTITPKAMLKDDVMETHPHIALSLTVNHQVIDGAPAAKFLQSLSQNLASISSLLIS
jgi:pyruvate dehydrogenase E2 component (dihydrolipoamide acetyltransferase)